MDPIVFIIGFGIFVGSFIILATAFTYYVVTGYTASRRYSPQEWTVKWDNSLWIYLSFLTIIALFIILYMLQYLGQGFAQKPNMMFIAYLRWVFITITSGIMIGNLSYVMFRKPRGAQSFFTVFFYITAFVFFIPASFAQDDDVRLFCIICSVLFFIATIILLFFPVNKITGKDYDAAKDVLLEGECTGNQLLSSWLFNYKILYVIHIIVIYIAYIIIWFLSDVNEFTTVLNFDNSMIAFLSFDILNILPFIIILSIMTYLHRFRKLILTDRATGQPMYLGTSHK